MNSGSSPASVAQYLRKHQIPWPVIVDPDRTFEAACEVNEISLNNIWQARIITASGELVRGNASDLDQAAAQALSGAAWNVDPAKMTPELQAAWQQIEFGNFAPAASTLKRMLRSRKPDTKTAAGLLQEYVDNKMKSLLDDAATAEASDDQWKAYKALNELQLQFKGYDLPKAVAADLTRLKKSDDVTNQIEAYRKLALARRSAGSRSASVRQRAKQSLQQLIVEYPGTDAAAEAQALMTID